MIFIFGVMAGSMLLRTSQNVQEAEERLFNLSAQVEEEQEAIRVLKAEWEYLNSPLRLEQLAKGYLPELVSPDSEQMMEQPTDLPDAYEGYEPVFDEAPIKPQPVDFSPQSSREPKEIERSNEASSRPVIVKPPSKPQLSSPPGGKKQPEKNFQDLLEGLRQGDRS